MRSFHVVILSVVFILAGSACCPDGIQDGPYWDGLEAFLFMIACGYACQVSTDYQGFNPSSDFFICHFVVKIGCPFVYFVSLGRGHGKRNKGPGDMCSRDAMRCNVNPSFDTS